MPACAEKFSNDSLPVIKFVTVKACLATLFARRLLGEDISRSPKEIANHASGVAARI